jgi:hypothetical protein
LPPIKKKKKSASPAVDILTREAVTASVDFEAGLATPIPDAEIEPAVAEVTEVDQRFERLEKVFEAKVLFCEPPPSSEAEALDTVPELAAKKPSDSAQSCRKHSRCHCHLFSQETEGFFAVTPQKK